MLVALLTTARGTALLYQGDELGLPDGDVPYELLRDPATRRFYPDYLQRDGARTPMPWQASATNAGFTTGASWLPIGRGHAEIAVDVQERLVDSTLAITRHLIALRRREPALRTGEVRFIDLTEPLLGFERCTGSRRLTCFFNVSASEARLEWPEAAGASSLAASGCTLAGDQIALAPWGFCVLGAAKA
jgi:alpha-glucosidase